LISSLELARICGVSQGTVDRALHDRPGINPETKARILAAARKHGYLPNPAAREIMEGKSATIGVVLSTLENIFIMDLLRTVKRALDPSANRLSIVPADTEAEFLDALRDFAMRRSRAVVAVPPQDGIEIAPTLTRRMPVVALLCPCEGKNVHFVSPDEMQTGRDAVAYLAGCGHERVLHLTFSRPFSAIRARAAGYEEEMRARGWTAHTVRGVTEDSLRAAMRRHRPTALFCHNDWLALRVLRMLEKDGIGVPSEVSILGVDNSPTFVALCPEITTLAYPAESVCARVSELILEGTARTEIARFVPVQRRTVKPLS
jgi:LacI family transcriptional regulator